MPQPTLDFPAITQPPLLQWEPFGDLYIARCGYKAKPFEGAFTLEETFKINHAFSRHSEPITQASFKKVSKTILQRKCGQTSRRRLKSSRMGWGLKKAPSRL